MTRTLLIAGFAISTVLSGLAQSSSTTGDRLLKQYLIIHESLASDSLKGIDAAAAEIRKISRQAAAADQKNRSRLLALSDAARLSSADLKSARNEFGELSEKLIAYWKAAEVKTTPPYQIYCSMVKKNWLQMEKTPKNPYYGKEMSRCGEVVALGKAAETR
ncbi:MAG: DUF3347 domain-containing protein [Acidobacteria bacterium]|nr:DUF3347 domain-containing protein [Acidobacteriota bacterium]